MVQKPSKVSTKEAVKPLRDSNGRFTSNIKDIYTMDFDQAMSAVHSWIGWKNYKPIHPPIVEHADQYNRILAINDLHVPYHDEDRFRYTIETNRGKVDTCVVVGDVSDLYAFSRYPHRAQKFTAVEEMIGTATVITAIAEAFPEVIIMPGNHDDRLKKHLMGRGIQGYELEALLYLNENALNPLAAIVDKLKMPHVKVAKPISDGYAEWNWIWQRGDLVLGHPEKFSKIPNKVATEFVSYLMRYRAPLGLQEFRVVGAGHTHQAGKVWCDYGVVAFEMGCLAMTPEYASDPRMPGARPAVKGYTLFFQDRETGRTNVNLSNFYELS